MVSSETWVLVVPLPIQEPTSFPTRDCKLGNMLVLGAQWQLLLASLLPALQQVLRNISVGSLAEKLEFGVFFSLPSRWLSFLPLYACVYFSLYSLFGLKSIFPSEELSGT